MARLTHLHAECKRDEAKLKAYLQRKRDQRAEQLAFREDEKLLRWQHQRRVGRTKRDDNGH